MFKCGLWGSYIKGRHKLRQLSNTSDLDGYQETPMTVFLKHVTSYKDIKSKLKKIYEE